MADGDVILRTPIRLIAVLMDGSATGSTTNGVWVDTSSYVMGTVTVIGAATTTVVEIDGLNDLRASTTTAPPAASNQGVRVTTAALTAGADTFVTLPTLPNWIKARITATGTGTVTVVLTAYAYPV